MEPANQPTQVPFFVDLVRWNHVLPVMFEKKGSKDVIHDVFDIWMHLMYLQVGHKDTLIKRCACLEASRLKQLKQRLAHW